MNPWMNANDPAEHWMKTVLETFFAHGGHLLFGVDGRFWHYERPLWRPVSDQWVGGRILKVIEIGYKNSDLSTDVLIRQTLSLLKAKFAEKDDSFKFAGEPPVVINCPNGELWIDANGEIELRGHKPKSRLTHCINVDYDPEAKCPQYDQALLEIFGASTEPEAMRRHWNEFMGYVIQPRRNIPIIVILLGRGANGKTVLIKTLMRLLGEPMVQAQRVEDLDRNRFAKGSLFGKLLFVDDDVNAGARLPDGVLKTISEAKTISGELKFKPTFNFTVRTVPVLLCNNIPSLADLSHGMLRRLMVIPFDRTFSDADDDPDLFPWIWENEMPGVLNRALAGLRRVIQRGSKFRKPMAVERASERLLQQANPLPAFIEASCHKGSGQRCLLRDFHAKFSSWAQASGFAVPQTQSNVRRNLEHLGYSHQHGNRGTCIVGLALNLTKAD